MTARPAARVPLPLPDPPLVDGPVGLRPWAPADAPHLVAAWADPEIARWTGVPPTADLATARRWIAGEADRRARGLSLDLVIEHAGAVAGEVGLVGFAAPRATPGAGGGSTAEIGWWVAPAHRGQGLAQRAAALVAAWCLEELWVATVEARCAAANPASVAVARGAGFTRAGAFEETEVWVRSADLGGASIGA